MRNVHREPDGEPVLIAPSRREGHPPEDTLHPTPLNYTKLHFIHGRKNRDPFFSWKQILSLRESVIRF